MTVGIYGIFDKRDSTCLYVGQSKDIDERWKHHRNGLRSDKHSLKDFRDWFHHNGEANLDFRILEECENSLSVKRVLESKWFNELQPLFYGKTPTQRSAKINGIATSELLMLDLRKDQVESLYEECSFSSVHLSEELRCSVNSVYALLRHLDIPFNRDRREKWEPNPIKCAVCPEFFTPKSKRSRTCSRRCRGQIAFSDSRRSQSREPSTKVRSLSGSSKGGSLSTHNRWHKSRGIINDSCEICKVEGTKIPETV